MKNVDRLFRGLGLGVTVICFALVLTPLSNCAAARLAPSPVIGPSGAIVVLGAGVRRGGMLDDESLRRTIRGIELYKMNLAPILVFSGPGATDSGRMTEAEVRTELAQTMGVPPGAILKDDTSATTREESLDIARMLQPRGVHRILLVTESLHLRRATYLFERAGFEVLPAPSDNFAVAATSVGQRFHLGLRVTEEATALIYYRLAGYL